MDGTIASSCVRLRFEAITPDNVAWVEAIQPGDVQRYWVHYNTYWYEISRSNPDIVCELIYIDSLDDPVGIIAYGQHYQDEALLDPVSGWSEVTHLVIDAKHQRRGFGREATVQAIKRLRGRPEVEAIVIAHNPENLPARALYLHLGFEPVGSNYDGDPLLRLAITEG